jgi:hypothetical protein
MGVIAGPRSGKEKTDVNLKHRIDGSTINNQAHPGWPQKVPHINLG